MRTPFTHAIVVIVLTSALASNGSCAHAPDRAMARPAGEIGPWTSTEVRDATRTKVREVLGAPSHVFNENVWIYFDYRADNVPTKSSQDTLVVVFEGEKLIGMKLDEGRLIRDMIAGREKKGGRRGEDTLVPLKSETTQKR
jgi:hypothetical protein